MWSEPSGPPAVARQRGAESVRHFTGLLMPMDDSTRLRIATREHLKMAAGRGGLYALIDSCGEPMVRQQAEETGEGRAQSLFKGAAQAGQGSAAPYLFQIDEKLLSWIDRDMAGKPWGVFAASQADMGALYRHFRGMLRVIGPNEEQLYFRFYDPRVLDPYITQCTPDEARRCYGPLTGYGFPGPGPGEATFHLAPDPSHAPAPNTPIRIRKEQVDFFQVKIEREVTQRSFEKLRKNAEFEKLSDDELRARVNHYMRDGRDYGMTWETTLHAHAESRIRKDLAAQAAARRA